MKKVIKITAIVLGVILVVLILTNPTSKDFKEYIGVPPKADEDVIIRRTSNWLIFSTYRTNLKCCLDIEYIGFFKNFYPQDEF